MKIFRLYNEPSKGRQMDSQMTPSNPSNDAFELNTTMYLGQQSLSLTVIIIIFTT